MNPAIQAPRVSCGWVAGKQPETEHEPTGRCRTPLAVRCLAREQRGPVGLLALDIEAHSDPYISTLWRNPSTDLPSSGSNRAGRSRDPSIERVIVADEAVEPSYPVVERPRRGIVLLRRPVEPGAAALARDRGNRFDQFAAATVAAGSRVDEQILQVADLAGHPSMGVEEIVGDPD